MKWLVLLGLWSSAAVAQGVSMPSNASLTFERSEASGSYALPLGPYADGVMASETMIGPITRQAWRIGAAGLTTFQLIAPLEAQLRAQGFDVVLTCAAQACGGFDFRFGIEVIDPPEMYVDLGDFRFLSARRDGEAVTVLASRSARAGFVQVIAVGSADLVPSSGQSTPVQAERVRADLGDFGANLEADGHVVLADLAFATGSSELGPGEFASLAALAEYLLANPGRTVALVGHTDAEGSLDGNIALSRRRAASVLERLVVSYSVSRGQLEAQGMGYLSPVANNLTAEGRDANRRVEVIITSTQ